MWTFTKIIRSHWEISIILAASLLLRLWRLDWLMTFGGDQGYDFEQIRQILEGNLTLLGPKIGPYNNISTLYLGPIYYYLLAPFFLIAKLDPIGAAVAYVLARVLATLLVYLIGIKILTRRAAIVSAIISAVSPYWFDSLGPPSQPYFIVTFFLLAVYLLVYHYKKTYVHLIIGLIIGICFQMHYLSIVVLIAFLALEISQKTRSRIYKLTSVIFGFLIGISPMILFELRHKFFLTEQLLKQLQASSLLDITEIRTSEKIAEEFKMLSSYVIGDNVVTILLIALPAAMAITIYKTSFKKFPKAAVFLIIILILNIIAVFFYHGKPQPHYLVFALSIIFIFIGALIDFFRKINRFIPAVLTFLIAINLLTLNNLFKRSGYTMPEDLTVKEIKTISKLITNDVGDDIFNVASTLDGDLRAGPYRYLTSVYGKKAQSVENYDKIHSLYLITRDPARIIRENKSFEIASFQPSYVDRVWEIKGNIRLIKLTKKYIVQQLDNFVTIINPVRPRSLWVNQSLEPLISQIKVSTDRNLPTTWLLQYDDLFDNDMIRIFKELPNSQEIGSFLEISQKLASDSKVSYKIADGDYYRPDKVFLSGYEMSDRRKMINTYLRRFRKVFGYLPKVTGAWYTDAETLRYLHGLGVISNLTLSDQYNTDAASIWGQYFSLPYYPSKYNSLEPATTQENKIPVVQVQWAQRDPVLGYGPEIKDSRHSFQANDYINNGFDSAYFDKLINTYLNNIKTDFNQITIGLETGQEGAIFSSEYKKQIEKIREFEKEGKLKISKQSDFASWYLNKYKGLSPSHFLEKDDNFWYMSQFFRVGVFKENGDFIIKDLTFFDNTPIKLDYYKDRNIFLDRKNSAVISQIEKSNQVNIGQAKKIEVSENFDQLTINTDNNKVLITKEGLFTSERLLYKAQKGMFREDLLFKVFKILFVTRNTLMEKTNGIKFSQINGKRISGIEIGKETILGLEATRPGIFTYDFQTLSKFKSPANLIAKWQPWIN